MYLTIEGGHFETPTALVIWCGCLLAPWFLIVLHTKVVGEPKKDFDVSRGSDMLLNAPLIDDISRPRSSSACFHFVVSVYVLLCIGFSAYNFYQKTYLLAVTAGADAVLCLIWYVLLTRHCQSVFIVLLLCTLAAAQYIFLDNLPQHLLELENMPIKAMALVQSIFSLTFLYHAEIYFHYYVRPRTNPLDSASLWSKYTFSWVLPTLRYPLPILHTL